MSIMLFGSRSRGGAHEPFHSAKPRRRLSCRRRSRQRSQCRREEEDDKPCVRCRRVHAVCTSTTHRRLGRPAYSRGTRERSINRQQRRQQDDTMEVETSECNTTGLESAATLATVPHLGVADLTPTSSGGCPSPPLSTPARRSSLDSEIEVSIEPVDDSMRLSQEEQDCLSNDPQHSSSMDQQEVRMQKLWNLQRLLYQQLKRIRIIAEEDSTARSDTEDHRRQLNNAPYPIDGILSSSQAFIDIVDGFKFSLAENDDDASSDDLSMDGSDREVDDIWDMDEDIKSSPSADDDDRLSSINAYDACPTDLMDTSTACMVVSCYARLMDIYDELFKSLSNLLQFVLWRKSTLQSTVPRFQLGEFQLKNCGSLQATIIVNIFVHALRCIEKTMGISEDHSVARRGVDLGDVESYSKGQFGEERMLDLVTALEANGSRDLKGRIESLHGSIRKVNELLDKIQSEQIEEDGEDDNAMVAIH
ncbi:hypothetical protein F4820DRAFT_80750 [Hypoxylon rubiginosum]|uniref:Uncharacterized protein n=1 Tax=Hypoxylon rubiginosum TaxID=110542 RepID=A0ACB9YPF2_9PEZI|nr:hypothetical protein F4820DRAFT_80750 [Hypoxylon rubiginosum]